MAVLALVLWTGTALVGLYLLAIWLIEYDPDFHHAAPSRLPVFVITGHVPSSPPVLGDIPDHSQGDLFLD